MHSCWMASALLCICSERRSGSSIFPSSCELHTICVHNMIRWQVWWRIIQIWFIASLWVIALKWKALNKMFFSNFKTTHLCKRGHVHQDWFTWKVFPSLYETNGFYWLTHLPSIRPPLRPENHVYLPYIRIVLHLPDSLAGAQKANTISSLSSMVMSNGHHRGKWISL